MKSLLLSDNYKMALASIRAARVRSFLTMLGIIIGVVSVITTVSLGEGVKNQISGQIGRLGNDLITVYPGNLVNRDKNGNITSVNLLSTLGTGTLSEQDLASVERAEHIQSVAPLDLITGVPKSKDKNYSSATVIATYGELPMIIRQKLDYGSFFDNQYYDNSAAVIGKSVALNLFNENVPIGKSITIRGQQFIVKGIFEKFESSPINPTLDLNNAIFIPYATGKKISGNSTHIFQILAKIDEPGNAQAATNSVTKSLKANHSGEEDFTVLKQGETLAIAQKVFGLVTGMVTAIAAISLLIGGIGIMNIMLVSVSDRKAEIGIRKAVGATSSQIRSQFLTEAITLCVWGALIGLFISGLLNILLRILTDLKPVITWQVIVVSTGVSIIVGIIFGLAPALRASMKDPIESLRNQ